VHELKAAITAFIQAHNDDPKPFIWSKTADDILQTIARYCSQTLEIQRHDLFNESLIRDTSLRIGEA
jgi:hypothetical protein